MLAEPTDDSLPLFLTLTPGTVFKISTNKVVVLNWFKPEVMDNITLETLFPLLIMTEYSLKIKNVSFKPNNSFCVYWNK